MWYSIELETLARNNIFKTKPQISFVIALNIVNVISYRHIAGVNEPVAIISEHQTLQQSTKAYNTLIYLIWADLICVSILSGSVMFILYNVFRVTAAFLT